MSPITTHVLDVALGRPAVNLSVTLKAFRNGGFEEIASGITNLDGRIANWMRTDEIIAGHFQIRYDTADYFQAIGCKDYFYPEVTIFFEIKDAKAHYHVPLLLSPFGYTTYRGS